MLERLLLVVLLVLVVGCEDDGAPAAATSAYGDVLADPSWKSAPGDALATDHLPDAPFGLSPDEMRVNPVFGFVTSSSYLLLNLEPEATVAETNALVADSGATVTGTIPSIGLLQLRFVQGDYATMEQARAALAPTVRGIGYDLPVAPDAAVALSVDIDDQLEDWGDPLGYNWGLEHIFAPTAWNLVLALQEIGTAPVEIGMYDVSTAAHSDLTGILDLVASSTYTTGGSQHGTHVAGTIAAAVNGAFTNGVTPFAHITLARYQSGQPWGAEMQHFIGLLAPHTPRVTNASMGTPWGHCPNPTCPCDPTASSPTDQCLVDARAVTEVLGEAFGDLIVSLNTAAPFFLVVSAGNSAPLEGDLNSPATWAARHHSGATADIIAAENLQQPGVDCNNLDAAALGASPGWSVVRRPSSNPNSGGVFAPGTGIMSLKGSADIDCKTGTSMAAPHVTGAVAFMLAVEPTLTNPELQTLLRVTPFADPGSSTAHRLNLAESLYAIDSIRPMSNMRVHRLMADMDDGTSDGFKRWEYADDGTRGAQHTDFGTPDGVVDMKDFRVLRDHVRFVEGAVTLIDAAHPKLDLNRDGIIDFTSGGGTGAEERWSRACLDTFDAFVDYFDDLDRFRTAYDAETASAHPQTWPSAVLWRLVEESKDVIVRLGPGVTEAIVSLTGEQHASQATVPSDLSPLSNLVLTEPETVLTTPLYTNVKLTWERAVDGQPQGNPIEVVVGSVAPDEDRDLVVVLQDVVPRAIVASKGATMEAFDPQTLTNIDACDGGMTHADLSNNLHTDFIQVIDKNLPAFVTAHPYLDELRFYSAYDCTFGLAYPITPLDGHAPGPAALDVDSTGQYMFVAHQDPLDACALGRVTVIDLHTTTIVASQLLPLGATDVAVVETSRGIEALITMTGNDTCPWASLALANLGSMLAVEADPNAMPMPAPVVQVPIGGTNTTRATRINRTPDYKWVAWVTEHADKTGVKGEGGRVGLMRAEDQSFTVADSYLHQANYDWHDPQDIVVKPFNAGVRAFVTYGWATAARGPETDPFCAAKQVVCSRWRRIDWEPGNTPVTSAEFVFRSSSAKRLALRPDGSLLFVAHNGGAFDAWGNIDALPAFLNDAIDGVISPAQISIP